MRLSIIVPCLDEAEHIAATLDACEEARTRGAEVIVVDGGSADDTRALARPRADALISAPRGRASQMNAGAACARGDVLLFLHADSLLPPSADTLLLDALAATGRHWGRFDVAIAGRHSLLPVIATLMNVRSRWTGIATGDQGLFVIRRAFERAGRFPEQPLMEDIALSSNLLRLGRPVCLRQQVVTSGRRWESHGVVSTVLLMWRLRLDYWRGISADELAARYAYRRKS